MKRLIVGLATTALLSSGVAGVLGAGTADGQPLPAPQSWPGCPADHPEGPCHWCPGDPPVQTGNLRVNPVVRDANVCHTYWYVRPGQGHVAQKHFRGRRAATAAATAIGAQFLPDTALVSVIS